MIDRLSPVTVGEALAPLKKDVDAFSTPLFIPAPGKQRASREGSVLGDLVNHVGFQPAAVPSRRASLRAEAARSNTDGAQAPLAHRLPTWRIEGRPLPEHLTMLARQMHDKLEGARSFIISPRYHPEFDKARGGAQELLIKLINALRAAAIAEETSASSGAPGIKPQRIEREYEKLCEALIDKLEHDRSVARGALPPGASQLLECIEYVMSPLEDTSIRGRSRALDVPRYFKTLERYAEERRGLPGSGSTKHESSENASPATAERDKRASVAPSETSDRGRWFTAGRLRGWLRRTPSTNK